MANHALANHALLRQLGVYTAPRFMNPEECAQWRSVAVASGGERARIYSAGESAIDENARKTLTVSLDQAARSGAEDRIRALRPDMEQYFGLQVDGLERLHCLMYRPGDFFQLHSDTREFTDEDHAGYADTLRRRVLTVLVFLNGPSDNSEPYGGGQLILYGLMSGASSKNFGLSVDVEPGLLIAFRSTTWHEVSPVTSGRRYTLVTWFQAPEPAR